VGARKARRSEFKMENTRPFDWCYVGKTPFPPTQKVQRCETSLLTRSAKPAREVAGCG